MLCGSTLLIPPGAQPHHSEHGTFFCSFFYSFWKPSTTSGKVFLFGFVFVLWSARILSRTLNCVSVSFVVNFQIPSGGSSSTADQYLGGLTKEWTRLWEKNTIWLKKCACEECVKVKECVKLWFLPSPQPCTAPEKNRLKIFTLLLCLISFVLSRMAMFKPWGHETQIGSRSTSCLLH